MYIGGPHRKFNKVMTAKEIFDEFLSENIKNEILRHSNKKGNEIALDFNQKNAADIAVLKLKPRQFRLISMEELDAFIGILLVMGVNGDNDDPPSILWGNYSHPLYKASLSRERFQQILRVIRFDNAFTRATRKQTDKAAPISDIWNMLMQNLRLNYFPDENVTVDEQLFPFRGRTSFTQYIPSKPAKYGIKIFWLCNTANSYPLNGIIYTGKPPGGQRQVNVGENIVLDLVDFYKQSGINVTTDNFFTSLPLANRLQVRGISLVGTLRQNKAYIPKELRPNPTDDIGTPRYGFNKNGTLLSVVTKKNKCVFLLSTMHYTRGEPAINGKEEINDFYNKTKGGVDVMDQMVSKYTTKRKTNRWPLAVFFNMIDVAALGAFCVYSSLDPSAKIKRSSRRGFLTSLGVELATKNMNKRANDNQITRHYNVRAALELMTNKTIPKEVFQDAAVPSDTTKRDKTGRLPIKGRCYLCVTTDPKSDRKTRKICDGCKRPMCNTHSKTIAPRCTRC